MANVEFAPWKNFTIYAKITAEKVSNDIENLSKQIESMESYICQAIW